ncbi:unnamed protein product [Amoebophrya sp. A120]|nr:unnamed protein product [Amoebophrya sp. A120]|eukprot:GSA120T00000278001.1
MSSSFPSLPHNKTSFLDALGEASAQISEAMLGLRTKQSSVLAACPCGHRLAGPEALLQQGKEYSDKASYYAARAAGLQKPGPGRMFADDAAKHAGYASLQSAKALEKFRENRKRGVSLYAPPVIVDEQSSTRRTGAGRGVMKRTSTTCAASSSVDRPAKKGNKSTSFADSEKGDAAGSATAAGGGASPPPTAEEKQDVAGEAILDEMRSMRNQAQELTATVTGMREAFEAEVSNLEKAGR